jgi:MYXO-CTERM domain-containing protein
MAPVTVLADPIDFDCFSVCDAYLGCGLTCALDVPPGTDCMAFCKSYGEWHDNCYSLTNCAQIRVCVCGASDTEHHDHGACSVAGDGPDLPLFLAMIAIGVFALALSRRGRKST